ncbi:MAG: sensor histidine kinase [Gemmataceae bacterium]
MSSEAEIALPRWELAAENIALRIRWLGLILGYLYVTAGGPTDNQLRLTAILGVGLAFTVIDTVFSLRGRVFLGRYPLAVSSMEALFIGLLCYYHGGLKSWFHYYYFLSLICCAIRHSTSVTYVTCGLHCLSVTALYAALPLHEREPAALVLTLLMLLWVTWAASSMALLVKHVGEYLGTLNDALRHNQQQLEHRIAERTQQLQDAQAQVLHQEKMAAFGLLAAGIAHEVGNPLTAISSIVQMLELRDLGPYTHEKLTLVSGQLHRIRDILRELVNFSRPSSTKPTRLNVAEVMDEALSIAKYYRGAKSRVIATEYSENLPSIVGVRGQLVQVFLNLVLNAIDATQKEGRINLRLSCEESELMAEVSDDGCGLSADVRERLFEPYFTTKTHGTGLGLFVTRKLLADLGGRIEVTGRPGGGTIFCVRLPMGTCEGDYSPEPVETLNGVVSASHSGR